jgi:peptide/nickel transport system ATP-binding protein
VNAITSSASLPSDVGLSVHHLSITYQTRRGPVQAVRDVSFDLRRGETLAIIGESGSGKTTLALGLIRLSSGSARVTNGRLLYAYRDGRTISDIRTLPERALRRFRWSECALVFQAAQNALNPVLTVWEQFLDTALAHRKWRHREVLERTNTLLDLVRLDPNRVLSSYPHELSGGMRQRVLLALGLLLEPQVVVLDEPTTALDILTQRAVIDLLASLRERLGFSMIFISHDLSLAAELADRVVTMYAGRIVEDATVGDLFYRPRHPYSVGLLRAVPTVTGALGNVTSIPGSPPDLIRLSGGCSYHPRCAFGTTDCLAAEPPLEAVDTPRHSAACIRWNVLAEASG